MALLPLSQGRIAVVDDEDLERLSQWKWTSWVAKTRPYAYRVEMGRKIRLHRFILDAPVGSCVDHINGDTLDNRKANLRLCTVGQNNANRAKFFKGSPEGKIPYKGVRRHGNRFNAVIAHGPKLKHLGCYSTMEEAAAAYDAAARQIHGPFAFLNFPEGVAE